MKPRVFVSSTYYDLKHVRERIEKFIDNFGFESVLFERDKVTYEIERPLDESAYNEVTLCHLMILIIGGRYGSAATEIKDLIGEQKKYESEFVSITRKEFQTATSKNIPIFVFIDKNVYSEYETFKQNQDFLENLENMAKSDPRMTFKFAHVDSTNVFKFIDEVKIKPIKTFDKIEEIEHYLQGQIAGLFYLYLDGLQKQREVTKVLDSVSELNNISMRMNEMLNVVGKKILGNENHEEYESVIQKQLLMIIQFYGDQFYQLISFTSIEEDVDDIDYELAVEISRFIYENILKEKFDRLSAKSRVERIRLTSKYNEEKKSILNQFLAKKDIKYIVENKQFSAMNNLFHSKVAPFLTTDSDISMLINELADHLESMF